MNLLQSIQHRFQIKTYQPILCYLKQYINTEGAIKNHYKFYLKKSILSIIFGKYSLFLMNVRAKKRYFRESIKNPLNLKALYSLKNSELNILALINESDKKYFEFYKIKICNHHNTLINSLLIYELRDLLIPYKFNKHLEYNKSQLVEGTYESENVFISPGDTVVDVGANLGIFSLYSIIHANASRVYSFEPMLDTFRMLVDNVNLNNVLDKVIPIDYALGNIDGSIQMYYDSQNMGGSSLLEPLKANQSKQVKITTLDSFVLYNEIEKIDFIKVDIEGAERLFIEGAKKTLRDHKPKISICTYHLCDDPLILTNLILEANPSYNIEYYSRKLYCY
jgi:FkbM family methyltransferase